MANTELQFSVISEIQHYWSSTVMDFTENLKVTAWDSNMRGTYHGGQTTFVLLSLTLWTRFLRRVFCGFSVSQPTSIYVLGLLAPHMVVLCLMEDESITLLKCSLLYSLVSMCGKADQYDVSMSFFWTYYLMILFDEMWWLVFVNWDGKGQLFCAHLSNTSSHNLFGYAGEYTDDCLLSAWWWWLLVLWSEPEVIPKRLLSLDLCGICPSLLQCPSRAFHCQRLKVTLGRSS